MATERLSMRKAREILRQKWELGRTSYPLMIRRLGVAAAGTPFFSYTVSDRDEPGRGRS